MESELEASAGLRQQEDLDSKRKKQSGLDNDGMAYHEVTGTLGINNLELPEITMVTGAICSKFCPVFEKGVFAAHEKEPPAFLTLCFCCFSTVVWMQREQQYKQRDDIQKIPVLSDLFNNLWAVNKNNMEQYQHL